MSKTYVLYNPLAGNKTCEMKCKELDVYFADAELDYIDFCSLDGDLESFFNRLAVDDKVILCGGDGTLNYLVNQINTDIIENDIFYFPAGSGNDFYNDVAEDNPDKVFCINKYLKNLPFIEVKNIKKRFINGIGYGIDGYCCEEGDKVRVKRPGKPVNYSIIALKGLLYDFHRVNAKITIDGVKHEYKDVWMAPSMHGKYFGGGMKCAPNQDRLNCNNKVSVIVVHTKSRLRLLAAFMSIFDGKHLKYTSFVDEYKGSDIRVEFDRPTALQIDGETVRDVLEYRVYRS